VSDEKEDTVKLSQIDRKQEIVRSRPLVYSCKKTATRGQLVNRNRKCMAEFSDRKSKIEFELTNNILNR